MRFENRLHILALCAVMAGCADSNDTVRVEQCKPVCTEAECGPDGCGGVCGRCALGSICYYGVCQSTACVPYCSDGTVCYPECDADSQVCQRGRCVDIERCTASCAGKECGDDGCGGSCGGCLKDYYCAAGMCLPQSSCKPSCSGKECGDNGCGGTCGSCSGSLNCVAGKCSQIACVPYCTGRVCGSDGCGGSCGNCPESSTCDDSKGACIPWRVRGSLFIETRTVSYDSYHLPKIDGYADTPGWLIPLSLRDQAGAEIGKATVNQDGSFEIEMQRQPLSSDWIAIIPNGYVNGELKFGLVVAGLNTPYPPWVWSLPLADYGKKDDYGDLGTILITEDDASGGLFIFQQLSLAYRDLISNRIVSNLSQLPSMAVVWKPEITWSCGSCYVHNYPSEIGKVRTQSTMYIGGDTADESAWGYPTLLHEFGHYVLASVYRDSTGGGMHNMSTACDPQLAWSEGWATFFSLMTQSLRKGYAVSQYWRVLRSGSYWIDYAHLYDLIGFGSISAPSPDLESEQGMKQDIPEAWVTYMLYNMWDGLDIPDSGPSVDPIKLGTSGIINTLSSQRYMKYSLYHDSKRKTLGVDFVDFVDALVCHANEEDFTTITDYIIENDFPYDLEPVCSN